MCCYGDVLLISDSGSLTDVVTRLFKHKGIVVDPVGDVGDAAKTLTHGTRDYRLIVLDSSLAREVNPSDLFELQLSTIPLVVLTAETDSERLHSLLTAETTDFLRKPFRPSSLLSLSEKLSGLA